MSDPETGEPRGVHRTFLLQDGSRKAPGQAKMMCGYAGVVRLAPGMEMTLGLGLAEGIETALSVMRSLIGPRWAATSAGAVRAFPLLPGIEALTIFSRPRPPRPDAAEHCAARWAASGRLARISEPPDGQDFNDLIRRRSA